MVRIPLYNKGLGPSQTIQATSVGPRASSGVFEAPGRAVMQAGQSAAQTAFNFGMKQKEAETRKEGDNYFVAFSEEAEAFRRDNKDTDTDAFQSNFKKFSDKKLKEIDQRKDLTNSQRESIKQSLSSTILSQNFKGQQESFRRGQIVRTTAATDALALKIKQASMVPPNHPDRIRISAEIDKQLDQNAVDGLRTGYSKQSIKLGFESLDFENRINASDTDEQFSAIERDLDKSGQSASARSAFRNKITTRKRELKSKSYDLAIGQITSLAVDFRDKEEIANAIMKGIEYQGVDNSGKEVIFNTSGLDNGQRLNLVNAVANPLFKDLTDTIQQEMTNEISDTSNPILAIRRFRDPRTLAENNKTPEDVATASVEAAEQLTQQGANFLREGKIELAEQNFSKATEILETTQMPNGRLLSRFDKVGDKAARTASSISTARATLKKEQQSQQRISALSTEANKGNLVEAYRLLPDSKKKEFDSVIEIKMQELDGDPQAQMDFLSKNGVIYEGFKNKLETGRQNLQTPEKTTLDDSDREAISIYRNLSLRQALLTEHIKGDDLTWWRSFEVLSDTFGDEQSLMMMKRQIPDIKLQLSEKYVDEQMTETDQKITEVDWWPFDKAAPQNTGYIKNEIKKLAMEYVKYGIGQEKALSIAGEQFASSHMFIGNAITPIMPEFNKENGVLKNIETIATVVIDDFVTNNKEYLEQSDLSATDLSLLPFPGTADNFLIVVDGGRALQDKDGQYTTLNQEALLKVDISKERLKSVNEQIKRTFIEIQEGQDKDSPAYPQIPSVQNLELM